MILRILSLLFGREQRLPLLDGDALQRVLLMRYDRLGDAIITTPAIAALKHIAPSVEIDVLCSSANIAYFEIDPRIHTAFVWPHSLFGRIAVIRRMRRRHYDAVFQLMLNKTTLRSVLAGIIAPYGRTIGKSMPGHDVLLNHAFEIPAAWHFQKRTFALIDKGVAHDTSVDEFESSIPIDAKYDAAARNTIHSAGLLEKAFLLLNVSAGSREREFSPERNAELATGLVSLGFEVAIMGAPADRNTVEQIVRLAGSGVHCAQFNSLGETIAGIGLARLVITPDTAIVHIASAMKRPLVVLYPKTVDPVGWGPLGVPFRSITTADASIASIPNSRIISAVGELLS